MPPDLAADVSRDLALLLRLPAAVQKVAQEDWADDLTDWLPDLSASHDEIVAELTQAFLNAYRHSNPNVPIDSTMTKRAATWALDRSGELIADISEATRDMVGELVASAVESGLSIGQLREALRDYSGFGRQRAETIARTESAFSLGAGQRAAAVDMSQDEMKWVGGGPNECEDCLGNEDDDWIGIDETFSDGSDNIPSHPNCSCSVIYRTSRLYADDTSDEEDSGDEEDKAYRPLVKEARCPDCHRLMGRSVNVGAQLWCGRCREAKTVV